MPANLENSAVATGLEKVVFIPIPKKDNAKECSSLVQFSSITQSCLTLCDSMDCSKPGLPIHHQLLEFTETYLQWAGMPSNHFILCCPLLLPPSIFPSIRVFSNESVLHIRWPRDWSFSFSISPSNEYSWFPLEQTGIFVNMNHANTLLPVELMSPSGALINAQSCWICW